MGGGRMETMVDEGRGQKIGSHIRLSGKAFGISVALDEVVTRYEPPRFKTWETVGTPKLLVIGHYRMGIEITPRDSTPFIVSLILVLSSPFWTYDYVSKQEGLEHVQFGFPLRYVQQQQTLYTPPFPGTFRMNIIMPQEGPTVILWNNFFANIFITSTVALVLIGLISRMASRYATKIDKRFSRQL